jgi:ribosome-associated protein
VPGNDAPHADGREIAVTAARAAAAKQAADVTILDVHGLIVITDYFVIASGETDRQVKTILEEVERAVRELGEKPIRREGDADSGWALLDYIDVVVHVFAQEEREYYDLERLWRDAPRLGWNGSEQAAAGSLD